MKITNRWIKVLLLGVGVFGSLCCFGFLIYRFTMWRDYKICYARLAKEFSVSPTYAEIGSAILDRIKSQTGPNPNRSEILSSMSSLAPIIELEKIPLSSGDIKQIIFLNTCKFTENGFDFIVVFSKEELVIDLLLYLDD
ncbi:MAG: hypothetical protein CVU39_20020 [Chloroflexi bacterium HGW-Chloroflexi-10]|nr:MAG: hypothetical protein CVU39_20020 [Chloroflexi bacterium HGW-Chloroflexi-10]